MEVKPVDRDQAEVVYKRLQSLSGRLSFYVGSWYAEIGKRKQFRIF